jgi:hypothetical protein
MFEFIISAISLVFGYFKGREQTPPIKTVFHKFAIVQAGQATLCLPTAFIKKELFADLRIYSQLAMKDDWIPLTLKSSSTEEEGMLAVFYPFELYEDTNSIRLSYKNEKELVLNASEITGLRWWPDAIYEVLSVSVPNPFLSFLTPTD